MRCSTAFLALACFFMFIPYGIVAQQRSNQAQTRQKTSQPRQKRNQQQKLKNDPILGGWDVTLRLSWGDCAFKLLLDKSADPLSGYILGDGEPCPLTDVTISGNEFRGIVNPKKCKLSFINLQDKKMPVDLTGSERDVITGTMLNDKFVGEYESDRTFYRWEAKRMDLTIPTVALLTPQATQTNQVQEIATKGKSTSTAQKKVLPTIFTLNETTMKLVVFKRAKEWVQAGVTGGGFSFSTSSAPKGSEFIILEYELSTTDNNSNFKPRYSWIEDVSGETYFTLGVQEKRKERGPLIIEQYFSVPEKTVVKAFHFGKLDAPASGNNPAKFSTFTKINLSDVIESKEDSQK